VSTPAPGTDADEIRILDDRGCLTLEAMCYVSQLQPEHRAVVERHIRACAVCAQQQMDLARVTERVRGARPRVPVPVEAKTLARQVALRSLAMRRVRKAQQGARHSTARIRSVQRVSGRWYRSRVFWAATLAGLATALVVAAIALILL
jgi:anti-sigma factor RsiW